MGDYSKLAEIHESEKLDLSLPAEILAEINTSPEGLPSEEVIRRFRRDGPNLLPEKREKSCFWYLGYLWGPIPLMIWAAITIEILRDSWLGFIVLLILQFVNGFMKWYQDRGSRISIKKLKISLAPQTHVKRDGRWELVPSRDLIIGDLIKIKLGDIVPADVILRGESEFDFSPVTGETYPVKKGEGEAVYQSTICKKGEIEAVIFATGIRTYASKSKQKSPQNTKTSFEKANFVISVWLLVISTVLVGVILLVVLLRGNDLLESLSICTVLWVASIPIALQLVCTTVLAVGANTMAVKKSIVTRLNAIEKLAGMDMLCVKKTGMLTRNELIAQQPVLLRRYTIEDIFLSAGLASKRTPNSQDPIDKCITDYATQKCRINFQAYEELEFIPFDSKKKRTEVLIQNTRTGDTFKCTKGAPQIILAMTQDPDIEAEVAKQVEDMSVRGYRALGVARTNKEGKWSMIGLIPLYDPPREDAKESLEKANHMQINIKLVTGDQVAISKETAKLLSLGDKIFHGELVCFDTTEEQRENLNNVLEQSDGFAEVFPEHKYLIVKLLQERGFNVGIMGSNVNDVTALKKADIGIAVWGAIDAAKSAADIILTHPGLSVVISAVHEARKTFQRLNNYYTYRIACTLQLLLFFSTTMIAINPGNKRCFGHDDCDKIPNTFALPVISLVIIAVLNDGTMVSVAYDTVVVNRKPYKLSLTTILWNSCILGVIPYISSVALLLMALDHMDKNDGNIILDAFRIESFSYGEVLTIIYLKVSLSDYLTVFAARTSNWFWSSRPAKLLMASAALAIVIATLISVYWFLNFQWSDEKSDFPHMKPLGWKTAAFVWGYNIIFFVFQDLIKVFMYRQQQQRILQNEAYYYSNGLVNETFMAAFNGSIKSQKSIITKRSLMAAHEGNT